MESNRISESLHNIQTYLQDKQEGFLRVIGRGKEHRIVHEKKSPSLVGTFVDALKNQFSTREFFGYGDTDIATFIKAHQQEINALDKTGIVVDLALEKTSFCSRSDETLFSPFIKEYLVTRSTDQFHSTMQKCAQAYSSAAATHCHSMMGRIDRIPGLFGFYMPGLALLASYRAEKENLQNLYVCEDIKTFAEKMEEIATRKEDGRFAFIIPADESGKFPSDASPHKIAVFAEMKDGKLNVAILDAATSEEPVMTSELYTITDDHWENNQYKGYFISETLTMRALKRAARQCHIDVFVSRIQREKSFGCAMFSLSDAETFLKDKEFFNNISTEGAGVYNDQGCKMSYSSITRLPPDYMIGTQSTRMLDQYWYQSKDDSKDLTVRTKRKVKDLSAYKKKYHKRVEVKSYDSLYKRGTNPKKKILNQYIAVKLFKCTQLVIDALRHNTPEEISARIDRHLLKKKTCDEGISSIQSLTLPLELVQ